LAQYDINLREYWRILKKRKFVVISFAIVLGCLTTLFAILRAPPPLYTASSLIEFEKAPVLEGIYSTGSSSDTDDIDTQITVIKSYAVFQKVAEELGLIPRGAVKDAGELREDIVPIIEGLQSKVVVTREGWTSILKISATDLNPESAKQLANTVALTYQEVHAEDQLKLTNKRLEHIAEQLAEARKRLRKSEDEFNRFSQENELISIDLQLETLLARSQQIEDELRTAQRDRGELEGITLRLSRFIKDPSGSGQDFFLPTANIQYQNAHNELVELLLKRDTLLKDFTPKHPEVSALSNQVTEAARKMVVLLESQIAGSRKKEIEFQNELERLQGKTKVLMDKKLEFDRLKRQVDREDEMTALLETEQQGALIRRSESPEEVKIIRPALPPSSPINSPKYVATGGTGIIIGLALGMIIGFIVETFDTSLGAIEDVEATLGTKVLGIIPQTDVRDIRASYKEKHPDGLKEYTEDQPIYLVSHFVPQSMMAESFRALRTSVQFRDVEKKAKSIAVASTSPKEGKTVVAINLALTMAQAGMKVLLVGSDLRKPTIDRVFGVGLSPGLTDVLMGNLPWRETIRTVMDMVMGKMSQTQVMTTPGLDNVHIITSGPKPPNPAELIESKALNGFLEEVKQEYDMVIFDSPPILSTADAAILAAKVDGVLLVYRVGTVSRGLLKRATSQLEQVGCNLMGVILNGMRPDLSSDFQDFRSYNYYYAYGSEDKGKKSGQSNKWWSLLMSKVRSLRTPVHDKEPRKARSRLSRKTHMGLWGLILLAVLSVVGGILFQSGIINPFRGSGDKRSIVENKAAKAVLKKEILKTPDRDQPTTDLPKPEAQGDGIPSGVESPSAQTPTVDTEHLVTEEMVLVEPPTRKSDESPSPSELPASDEQPEVRVEVPVWSPSALSSGPKGLKVERKVGSYPFSLQLGAFRDLSEADKLVASCEEKGLIAYWAKVELRDGIWYRVFVGYFEDRERAEAFKHKHGLLDSRVKNTNYANLIGTYSSSSEVDEKVLSLRRSGYSPYIIKDPEGNSRIFVGVFLSKEGAENQYDDLKADGIENQITSR
jgi:succinoglycan biosynthesis transport protein ExoP